MGRLESGKTVFVPRSAPGDLIELAELDERARFARARIGQVLEPGPDRIVPRCPHYLIDRCGGCQLQHLTLPAQREAKRGVVADAISRIGKLNLAPLPLIPGDQPWGYRTRITLTLDRRRRFAGFHQLHQADRIFPLAHCDIAAPRLNQLWQQLQPHLRLLPPDTERLTLRLDGAGGRHIIVDARGEQVWTDAAELAGRLGPPPVTIWWHPEAGAPRVVAGARTGLPATAFEQVQPGLGQQIRDFALEHLGDIAGAHAWDLYAGIGETTRCLLARGATVESVELDRRSVAYAAEQEADPAPAVERHVGRVEELIGRLRPARTVIVNPPRAGMEARVSAVLRRQQPARLVYISCDPATLGRDLARLCGPSPETGSQAPPLRLTVVQPFDLFPQTAHVETVAVMEAP